MISTYSSAWLSPGPLGIPGPSDLPYMNRSSPPDFDFNFNINYQRQYNYNMIQYLLPLSLSDASASFAITSINARSCSYTNQNISTYCLLATIKDHSFLIFCSWSVFFSIPHEIEGKKMHFNLYCALFVELMSFYYVYFFFLMGRFSCHTLSIFFAFSISSRSG